MCEMFRVIALLWCCVGFVLCYVVVLLLRCAIDVLMCRCVFRLTVLCSCVVVFC